MLTWEDICEVLGEPNEIIECEDGVVMSFGTDAYVEDDYVEDDYRFPWDDEDYDTGFDAFIGGFTDDC